MSSLWTPRIPANLSLTPAQPVYAAVEGGNLRHQMEQSFRGLGILERMASPVPPPAGYYRLRTEDGLFFVKVLAAIDVSRQVEADRVARFVAGGGFSVSLLRREVSLTDGHVALVYDYIGERFPAANATDAAAVGEALARLHIRLASAPMVAECRAAGLARLSTLAKVENGLRAGSITSNMRDLILRLSDMIPEAFGEPDGAQMVHGDLNLANLLMGKGGAVSILDFEDSLSSWLHPLSDVAMALQRMVLCSAAAAENVLLAGGALLQSYEKHGAHRFTSGRSLQKFLLWLSLRSLCFLVYMELQGRAMPTQEWDKFVFLARQAEEGLPLFDEMVRFAAH